MKTQRFNVFNQIHKALRALMFDTALLLQQTDLTHKNEAEAVFIQTDMLLALMDAHAHHEDNFILSKATLHAPDVIGELEQEHVTDLQLTAQLRDGIANYRRSATVEQRLIHGSAISMALNAFIAFNLNHMHKEETVLNELLWANYTDEEILEMELNIQQQISPDQLFIYFEWMVRALNDAELLIWLRAVKNDAPEFVFNGLWQLCEQHLAFNRRQHLEQHLTDGALVW